MSMRALSSTLAKHGLGSVPCSTCSLVQGEPEWVEQARSGLTGSALILGASCAADPEKARQCRSSTVASSPPGSLWQG